MARPRQGYKLKDGSDAVGTTTVINRFKDSGGLINWAFAQGKAGLNLYDTRDAAADIGSYVHELIEADIDKADPPEPPKGFTEAQINQAQEGFGAFVEWTQQTRLTIVRKETPLTCECHRNGGTPDAWAMINDRLDMLDWKSSKQVYYDYVIQLADYKHLHEVNYPDEQIGGIHIIRFGKTGCDFTHRYFRADHPALAIAWRQFQLMREAYEIDRELKRIAA